MNAEKLQELITQFTPLLADVLTKQPPQRPDLIRMTGKRLIDFLQACPTNDVRLIAIAIDPDENYVFGPESLRELANPDSSKTVSWPNGST